MPILFAVDLSTLEGMVGKTPEQCELSSIDEFIEKARLIYQNSVKFNVVNLGGTYKKASVHGATVDFHKAVEKCVSSLREVAKVDALLSQARAAARTARMEGFAAVPQSTQLQLAQGILADVLSRPSHKPFYAPVTGVAKYNLAIPRPRCLQQVSKALQAPQPPYKTIVDVVDDIRLVFGNAVEFNINASNPFRKKAITELDALHDITNAHPLLKVAPGGVRTLMHGDKQCRKLLEDILNDANSKQLQRFWQFTFRIEYSFEGQRPPAYDEYVSKPMWLGRVAHLLYTRAYASPGEMVSDILRMASNAETYWQPGRGGAAAEVLAQAADLRARVSELCEKFLGMPAQGVIAQGTAKFELPELGRGQKRVREAPAQPQPVLAESRSSAHDLARAKAQSAAAAKPAAAPVSAAQSATAPKMHKYTPRLTNTKPRLSQSGRETLNTCLNVMNSIAEHVIDSAHSSATVMAGQVFGKPVDLKLVPDYLSIIKQPMDFATVKQKLFNLQYRNVDDWRKDMQLIFDNCVKYNSDLIAGADMRHIANNTAKRFKSLFEFTFPYTEGVDFYEGPRYTPTRIAPKQAPPQRVSAAPPTSLPAPAALPAGASTSTFGTPSMAGSAAANAFAAVPPTGAPAPAPENAARPRVKLKLTNRSAGDGSAAPPQASGPAAAGALPQHLSSMPPDAASRQSAASQSSFMPPPSPAVGQQPKSGLKLSVSGSANASAGVDTPAPEPTPKVRQRITLKAGVQPGMVPRAEPATPQANNLSQLPENMQQLARNLIEQGSSMQDALGMVQRMMYATAMHSAAAARPPPTPVEEAPSGVKLALKFSGNTPAASEARPSRRAAARKQRVTLTAPGGGADSDEFDTDSDGLFDAEEDDEYDAEAAFLNKLKRGGGGGRRGSAGGAAAAAPKRTPKPKAQKQRAAPRATPSATPGGTTTKATAAPTMSADGMPIYRSSRYRGRGAQTFDGGLPPLPADMARLEWVGAAKGALRQLRISKYAAPLAHLELPIPAGEERIMQWETALEAKGIPESERLRLRWQDTNEATGAVVWRVWDLDFVEKLLDPTKSFTTATNGTMRKTISDKERARIEKANADARARRRKSGAKKQKAAAGASGDMVAYDSDDIEAGEEGNFGEMLDLDIVSHFEHPLQFNEAVMKAFDLAESLFAQGVLPEPDTLAHAMRLRVKFLRDLWSVLWDEWVAFCFDAQAAARKQQRLARRALEAEAAPVDDAGTKLINVKLLKRLKGGKNKNKAYYFLDLIENSFSPELWEMYSAVVPHPMDFPKVEDALTGGKYKTFGDCLRDIRLIFTNAIKFNQRSVDVTSRQVVRAAEDLLEEVDLLWKDNAWLPWLEAHASKFEKELYTADRAVRSDYNVGYDLHSTYIIAQKKPVKARTLALLHIENERQQEAEARRAERRALNGEDSDSRVEQSDIGGSGSSRGGRSDSEAEVFDEEPSDGEHAPLGGGQFDVDTEGGRLGSKRRRRLTARGRQSLRGTDIADDSDDEDASVVGDFNPQDSDEDEEYDEIDDMVAEDSAPREKATRTRNLGAARVASGAGTVSDVLENAVDAMMEPAAHQKSMRALPAQGGKSGTLLDEVMGALVKDVMKPEEVELSHRKAHESTGSDTLGGKNARVVALRVTEQLLHSRRLPWALEAAELGRGALGAGPGEDSARAAQLCKQAAHTAAQQQAPTSLLAVPGVPSLPRSERMSAVSQLPPSLGSVALAAPAESKSKAAHAGLSAFADESDDEDLTQAAASSGVFQRVPAPCGSGSGGASSGEEEPPPTSATQQQPHVDLPLQAVALPAGVRGSTLLFAPPGWTSTAAPKVFSLGTCSAPDSEPSAIEVHSLVARPVRSTPVLSAHPALSYVTLAVSAQPGVQASEQPVDWERAALRFVSDATAPAHALRWAEHVAWLQGLRHSLEKQAQSGEGGSWGAARHNPHLGVAVPASPEADSSEQLHVQDMDGSTARQLSVLRHLDFTFMPSLGCYMAVCGDDTPVLHLLGFADTLATTLEEQ